MFKCTKRIKKSNSKQDKSSDVFSYANPTPMFHPDRSLPQRACILERDDVQDEEAQYDRESVSIYMPSHASHYPTINLHIPEDHLAADPTISVRSSSLNRSRSKGSASQNSVSKSAMQMDVQVMDSRLTTDPHVPMDQEQSDIFLHLPENTDVSISGLQQDGPVPLAFHIRFNPPSEQPNLFTPKETAANAAEQSALSELKMELEAHGIRTNKTKNQKYEKAMRSPELTPQIPYSGKPLRIKPICLQPVRAVGGTKFHDSFMPSESSTPAHMPCVPFSPITDRPHATVMKTRKLISRETTPSMREDSSSASTSNSAFSKVGNRLDLNDRNDDRNTKQSKTKPVLTDEAIPSLIMSQSRTTSSSRSISQISAARSSDKNIQINIIRDPQQSSNGSFRASAHRDSQKSASKSSLLTTDSRSQSISHKSSVKTSDSGSSNAVTPFSVPSSRSVDSGLSLLASSPEVSRSLSSPHGSVSCNTPPAQDDRTILFLMRSQSKMLEKRLTGSASVGVGHRRNAIKNTPVIVHAQSAVTSGVFNQTQDQLFTPIQRNSIS